VNSKLFSGFNVQYIFHRCPKPDKGAFTVTYFLITFRTTANLEPTQPHQRRPHRRAPLQRRDEAVTSVVVVGGRDGSSDGVRRERCEHIGRGDDGRHEPLELHERRAAGARRQRARGHRVHAVSVAGRSPAAGQLHGGGHVPGNTDRRQPPVGGRPAKVEDSLRPHARLGAAQPERVR